MLAPACEHPRVAHEAAGEILPGDVLPRLDQIVQDLPPSSVEITQVPPPALDTVPDLVLDRSQVLNRVRCSRIQADREDLPPHSIGRRVAAELVKALVAGNEHHEDGETQPERSQPGKTLLERLLG